MTRRWRSLKRIWHPWTSWECYPAGMYDGKTDLSPDECKLRYAEFLRDTPRFEAALSRVLSEWPLSCEHFLSNDGSNRIAWLGQASMCIETGISSVHRAGFKLLTNDEQRTANETAARFLAKWCSRQGGVICENVDAEGIPAGHTGRSAGCADDTRAGPFIQGDLFCAPEE